MMRLTNRYGVWILGIAAVVCAAALGGAGRAAVNTTFPGSAITFNDCCNNAGAVSGNPSSATQYPSTITVSSFGPTTTVQDVNVSVTLDHAWPDDVDLLLVGPSPDNVKVLLMSDAGGDGGNAITPDTLVFDDAAAAGIPASGQLEGGTYKPTNAAFDCDQSEATSDKFPGAAVPAGTANATLAAFDNHLANGSWRLFAVDDCNLGNVPAASISAWSLTIAPNAPTNVTLTSFAAKRAKQGAVVTWKTAVEGQVLGFNVYRVAGKKSVKVNKAVIAAKAAGTSRGAKYSLADKTAKKRIAYTYRLQWIDLQGKKAWLGTASLRAK